MTFTAKYPYYNLSPVDAGVMGYDSQGNYVNVSPTYKVILLSGPACGEAGQVSIKVVNAAPDDRSGDSLAELYVYYDHQISGGNRINVQLNDELGNNDLHPATLGRTSFLCTITVDAGWIGIGTDAGNIFGTSSTSIEAVAVLAPAPVPAAGAYSWTTYTATGDGVLRVGSTDWAISTEVYRSETGASPGGVVNPDLLVLISQGPYVQVENGTTYYIKIIAATVPSSPVSLQYTDPQSPLATQIPTSVDVSLTWKPPAHDGGTPLTGYTLTAHAPDATLTTTRLPATATTLTATVVPGAMVWLSAQNAVGASAPALTRRAI